MDQKTEKMSSDEITERNMVVLAQQQYELAEIEKMKEKLPSYIKTRKRKFAKEFKQYVDENSSGGAYFSDETKIPMYKIINHTFEPLVKSNGICPNYSANELSVAFDFYKDVAEQMNDKDVYTPKIEDFCALLNISKDKFTKMQSTSSDEQIREVCNRIQDFCVARIADGAFSGRLEKNYAIFHQKSSNKQRDNDPVQNNTFIQHNTVMSDEKIAELYNKFINE